MSLRSEGSSVLGWMSIACWIIVYSPQIYENYDLQSGEGLSISFVIIWLLGDVSNLVGASMAGLLPTIILLAVYYTFCDIILLVQIYYYRWRASSLQTTPQGALQDAHETDPLLESSIPSDESSETSPKKTRTKQHVLLGRAALYFYATLFVSLTGVVAFFVNRANRHDETQNPTDPTGGGADEEILEWKIKNAKTKCTGLSLGMFIFALGGNLTYVLSIVVASTSKRHLVANASWLAGSGLTMFLDFIVLYQFFHYRSLAQKASRVNQP
ncbi:hypothetical protein FRB98_005470 [Tulasnella sp. 332]|nr:hypothetical protein FRB98_005470 [Tulasnella sp. 332]